MTEYPSSPSLPMTVRLDLTTAVVLAIVFAIGYVAPFYLLFPSRLLALSREHPEVIRRRILCVSVSTTLSVGMTSGLLAYLGIGDVDKDPWPTLSHLGLSLTMPDLMTRALLPLCIMGILFAGPILLELLYLPRLHWKRDVVGTMTSLAGWRTYVVGPVTEEVVFRSCILLPLALAGMSPVSLILLTPLFFGFAHFHHARESYIQGGRTREALRVALIRSTFQFTYTYIFGLYEATSLIYTGSLYGPIMCHMLANILGFPDPGEARNYPRLRLGTQEDGPNGLSLPDFFVPHPSTAPLSPWDVQGEQSILWIMDFARHLGLWLPSSPVQYSPFQFIHTFLSFTLSDGTGGRGATPLVARRRKELHPTSSIP
ncbi:MAG: hypothetical protein DHS80DRAFT_29983 [Piptocephalis tieghemiana]|nr:MAG: hypothetical protein DHS80DRAFT_29983 [Piptocephalis tieghemiana]